MHGTGFLAYSDTVYSDTLTYGDNMVDEKHVSPVFQKNEPAALTPAEVEMRSSRGTPLQVPPPKPPRVSSASLNPFGSDFEDDDDNNDDGISLNSSRRSMIR